MQYSNRNIEACDDWLLFSFKPDIGHWASGGYTAYQHGAPARRRRSGGRRQGGRRPPRGTWGGRQPRLGAQPCHEEHPRCGRDSCGCPWRNQPCWCCWGGRSSPSRWGHRRIAGAPAETPKEGTPNACRGSAPSAG